MNRIIYLCSIIGVFCPVILAVINLNYWGDIEQYCQYWKNSSPIRKRVEDLDKASAHTALFLEYISQNLYDWLSAQITKDNDAAEAAVAFVDTYLKAATMKSLIN